MKPALARALRPRWTRVTSFKISNDPRFVEKVIDVVGLHLNPPGALEPGPDRLHLDSVGPGPSRRRWLVVRQFGTLVVMVAWACDQEIARS